MCWKYSSGISCGILSRTSAWTAGGDGIENIPESEAALIVANHAGVVALDGLMVQLAVHDRHPKQRALRLLAADLVFETPIMGGLARKAGHARACRANAERMLRSGELVGVFLEGFKGVGKPYSERYKLQRFGRGGFASAAVRTGVPIVPCSIVGSEEIYPKLADLKPLARLLGLPNFPVTPLFPHLGLLGGIPLPSKWYIEFGEPPTGVKRQQTPEKSRCIPGRSSCAVHRVRTLSRRAPGRRSNEREFWLPSVRRAWIAAPPRCFVARREKFGNRPRAIGMWPTPRRGDAAAQRLDTGVDRT